jgi:hypothetical protein
MLPLAKIDARGGRLLRSAVPAPGRPRRWEETPVGTHVIPDYGVRFTGGISFEPTVKELLVLDDETTPLPEVPENDGRKWQEAFKFQLLIEGAGLYMFSVTSEVGKSGVNRGRFRNYLQLWKLCPQAQRGQLQECIVRGFELVSTVNGDFFGLIWEPLRDRWHDRDPAIFGPRLIAPPPPMMTAPPPRPQLVDGTADGESQSDSAPPWPTAMKVAPVEEAEAPAAPKSADPFAAYRPAGANPRPNLRPR